jgi:hypothetical protein
MITFIDKWLAKDAFISLPEAGWQRDDDARGEEDDKVVEGNKLLQHVADDDVLLHNSVPDTNDTTL